MGMKTQFGKIFTGFLSFTIFLTACSVNHPQEKLSVQEVQKADQVNLTSMKIGEDVSEPSIRTIQSGNDRLISVEDFFKTLDFRSAWDENQKVLKIGDSDVLYAIYPERSQAVAEDSLVELPQAPRVINGQAFMTPDSLAAIMGTSVTWDSNHNLAVQPIDDNRLTDEGMEVLGLPQINEDKIVTKSLNYKGVPYLRGADPYPKSRRFDCSSFVRYLYRDFGVHLPRTARAQARKGIRVSMKDLQKGDLLFFYTPGRFKSNKIVGHVGMYIGRGKMIHTYGKPGVTISPVHGYWQTRFLFAKRLAR
ncbi:C40 family peptidase [Ammoniphilus resinae]|uniref:NlpC/P60 domain-containing protein n=1 Tax=Ammoniphilus resinae TaxID=861532 RepID=A0ABS4GLR9_9BACL|nr:C40 family peptidase [Ammoniphilus resinae]MBP1931220.1 hypothetical protein [Ammoniphilus resinae]